MTIAIEQNAPPLAPVTESARIRAVDVLRGFAVLGILAMNIIAFALPSDAYIDPMSDAINKYAGAFAGGNYVVWLVSYLLIDMKMMSIFSMLFGAGLVLMHDRAAGSSFARIYYRRMLWLLLFGLIHAYLFWYGDILTMYALCGLVLYPMRRWRPRTLIVLGIAVMLVAVLIESAMGGMMFFVRWGAEHGSPGLVKAWADMSTGLTPIAAEIDAEVAALRGSLFSVLRQNAVEAFFFQALLFPLMMIWRAGGLMLVGMGLMKLGVFSAQRSRAFYLWMTLIGYGIGLPLIGYGAYDQIRHRFDMIWSLMVGWHFNYVGSFFVALGHVGVVMIVVQSGALRWLVDRLAAVGRMALTNYLVQTLICTFIFFGWGLGYFGYVQRQWLPLFVVGIWIIQLLYSPLWLHHFRFGPMEWLWRTLTYWKRQPFSRATFNVGMT